MIFANETSFGTLINWQVERIVAVASWCRAFPPNGKTIMVYHFYYDFNYCSSLFFFLSFFIVMIVD